MVSNQAWIILESKVAREDTVLLPPSKFVPSKAISMGMGPDTELSFGEGGEGVGQLYKYGKLTIFWKRIEKKNWDPN